MSPISAAEFECFLAANDALLMNAPIEAQWRPNNWPSFSEFSDDSMMFQGKWLKYSEGILTYDGEVILPFHFAKKYLSVSHQGFKARLARGERLRHAVLPIDHTYWLDIGLRKSSKRSDKAMLHGATKEEMKPKPVMMNNHFLKLTLVEAHQ